GRARVELGAELAHAQCAHALGIQELDRGGDDLVAAQSGRLRLARRAGPYRGELLLCHGLSIILSHIVRFHRTVFEWNRTLYETLAAGGFWGSSVCPCWC